MNLVYVALLFSFILYGFIFDRTIIYINGIIFSLYILGYVFSPNSKYNSLRRKIMIASWVEPEEPNIVVRAEYDCTNLLQKLEQYPLKQ